MAPSNQEKELPSNSFFHTCQNIRTEGASLFHSTAIAVEKKCLFAFVPQTA